MALRFSENDPNLNPGQADYNRKFNDLKKAESAGTNNETTGDSGAANDVKNAEENPLNDWQNNVVGKKPQSPNAALEKLGFLKRKGPLITIATTITALVGGIGLIGSPALMTQSILANLVQKFNIQETSLSIRANKMLVSKLVNGKTSGVCNTSVTILCKFTKPSNYFLKQLEKNGIQALDKDGNVIKSKTIFSNTRPDKYKMLSKTGSNLEVEAKDLSSKLLNNAEFRAAFTKASSTRFMSLTDSVFQSIKIKFGFNVKNKLSKAASKDDLIKKVGNEIESEGSAAKAFAGEGADVAEEEIKTLLKKEATATSNKLSKVGKGNLFSLAAGTVCLITDIPKFITKTVRAYQITQLIKYSMVFLSAFGSIKAGDATPDEVSTIGKALTTQDKNGKSAMDSFGMNYSMTGATKPSNNNYKDFIPGGAAADKVGKYNSAMNSKFKVNTCKVATSQATGVAVDIALTDTTIIGGLINIVAGIALGEVIEKVAPPIISVVASVIPTKTIIGWFVGDLTKEIAGEDVGDALTSGASHIMGQTANAGGNMPLTVEDAVAYNRLTDQVQLAYAEEDRATLSPFDTSSPNTLLGSIMQKMLPYYSSAVSTVGSITHSLSFIGNIISGSFGSILQPIAAGATSSTEEYGLCGDPMIENSDVAAGPYCNVIYGVPEKYLDKDPVKVLAELGDENVNPTTGEPVEESDLASWISLCTDGSTDSLEDCKITKDTANYALYTIDHRIQRSLDGEGATSTATTETTEPATVEPTQ